jgi:hypothetical protein
MVSPKESPPFNAPSITIIINKTTQKPISLLN